MNKKRIIVSAFLLLILVTVVYTVVAAIDSYNYDMDPANGVDILEGLGAALTMLVGGFAVIYELDLFYMVYYFVVKPKTKAKTVLNILAHIFLLLAFFNRGYKDIFAEDVIAPLIVFAIYVVLRLTYFSIPNRAKCQEKHD